MVSSGTNSDNSDISDSTSRNLKKRWKKKKLAKLHREWAKLKQKFEDSSTSADESGSEISNHGDNTETLPQTMGAHPPTVPEENQLPVENTIHPDVLLALGEKPKGEGQNWGPEIHNEIVNRWENYLHKGITTEEKQKLIETYPPPSNCAALKPPILNAEMVAALKSPTTKQDTFLKNVQELVAASLTALAAPLNKIITDPNTTMYNKTELLPALIDASKALTGAYQSLSLHRRYLITPSLKENHRKTVQDSPIDEHLFGTNLQESLKTSQAVKRTGEQLRGQATKKSRYSSPSSQPSTSKRNFHKPASNYSHKYRTNQKASNHRAKKKEEERKWTKRH